jgi:hypothetical protein
MTLRVLTWLWSQPGGRTTFTATHVNIWAAMIRRHCTLDIDIACVTDMPGGIDPSVRIIAPPGFHDGLQTARWKGGRPSCYRRIAMFRPDAAAIFGERFCCMDLDVVIGANIDAILSRPEDIVLNSPSQIGSRWIYNGSMLLMTAGARPRVYEEFTPEKAEQASLRFVGSDQAWLAYSLGRGEATFGPRDGVHRWGQKHEGPIVFFPGDVKPWDVLGVPWVAEHYRLEAGRSGLVLGNKRSVWDEAREAMRGSAFDHVVALPQAAEKWPGRVDAVAKDFPHARALSRMLGVETPVVCGA